MSRTYRVRHLPKIGGKKYVDSNLSNRHQYYRKLAEKSLSPDLDRWAMVRYELVGKWMVLNVPVECTTQHPWVSWSRIGSVKTWYKKNGNRKVRRHNRHMVMNHHLGEDIDQRDKFYDKKDGWDVWSIT